jgi:hypothetical protein
VLDDEQTPDTYTTLTLGAINAFEEDRCERNEQRAG